MAVTQQNRFVAVDTPLGKDVLLLRNFSYSEALGSLFELQLDLVRQKADVKFSDIIGQNVTLRLRMGEDKERYFNGYVRRFSCVGHEEGFARYNATVVPWLWFLTQSSDCRIFQNKTVPQIIEEVFGDPEYAGVVDFDKKGLTRKDYREWEYCVQYRETDFNFVSRLMEQEGIYYYWKHENGGHTMVLADDPSIHEPYPDYESLPYYPPTQELREREHVFQWDVEQEVRPRVYTHTDFNFKTPRADIKASRKWKPPHVSPELEIFDFPGEYTNGDEGGAYARTRIEEIQRDYEVLRGETTARGISAGFTFELTNHPSQEQQRDYLVTGVSLSATSSGFYSGETEAEDFNCSFTAMDASQPYRHPRTTPKPSIPGPQTAIVTGPKGEEIWPDEYARVKVQFHWDRYGKSDQDSSCWIRVAQLWAGKSWGAMYIPRIGQEVIVEFLEGDPDQPIITGRVYNAQCMPPYGLPGEKTKSTIKSDSSKGGGGSNEIRLEDKKGSEQVYIHAQKDMSTVVENDKSLSVGHDESITVGNDRTKTVKHDEKTTIQNDRTTEINDGHEKLTVKTGNRLVDVNTGDDKLTVKTGNRLVDVNTGDDKLTVKTGKKQDSIKGPYEITVESQYFKVICGSSILTLNHDGSIEMSGINVAINGQQSVNIHGASVTSEADMDHNTSGQIVVSSGTATNTVRGGMVMLNP